MASITHGQTIESSLIAELAGYVPAAAVLERGQRQEARVQIASVTATGDEFKALAFLRVAAW